MSRPPRGVIAPLAALVVLAGPRLGEIEPARPLAVDDPVGLAVALFDTGPEMAVFLVDPVGEDLRRLLDMAVGRNRETLAHRPLPTRFDLVLVLSG